MVRADRPPSYTALTKTIEACVANGERLIGETYNLEFEKPPSSRLVLSMIAQEEFAKAFLLFLVREGTINWSPYLLRAMNDHSCKQLVGAVIDYISPHWDESYEQMVARIHEEVELGDNLPFTVADAIAILRHEKLGRWESKMWEWAEPPNYDATALRIARGDRDRRKQDALYVRIGRDGSVVSSPLKVTESSSDEELKRAQNYAGFITELMKDGGHSSSEYLKIKTFIKALFARQNA